MGLNNKSVKLVYVRLSPYSDDRLTTGNGKY